MAVCYSIAGKGLKITTEDDIKSHLDALRALESVESLDFSGNTLGLEASKALAATISENSAIRDHLKDVNFADLYTSRLVDEVVASLAVLLPALLKCPKLTIVNLSDNAFGLRTIDHLEQFIENAVQLRHLLLSNNGMGPFAGERIGKALYKLAENKRKNKSYPPLETFICGRNRLENGSSLYLALGLKNLGPGLKTVKLYQNGIRPQGVSNLIHYGLQHNPNLEILDLQDNTFTKSASMVLALALPTWKKSLKELNLNDCLLKGDGARAVLEALHDGNFQKLETLKLEYNELTQDSLEEFLLPAIKNNKFPSIKTLELNGNILDEDSEALVELSGKFDKLILDDLEDPITDSEEEEDEDESDNDEKFDENIDVLKIESEIKEIDELTDALAQTTL